MMVALSRCAPSAMLSFLTPFFCTCSTSLRASSCSRSSISLAMRCSSRFSLHVTLCMGLWPSKAQGTYGYVIIQQGEACLNAAFRGCEVSKQTLNAGIAHLSYTGGIHPTAKTAGCTCDPTHGTTWQHSEVSHHAPKTEGT